MKRLLFFGILFVSMGVSAGWRWERVDVVPPTENPYSLIYEAVYDPASDKIFVLGYSLDDRLMHSYLFDGQTFEDKCAQEELSNEGFSCGIITSVYYDENLGSIAMRAACFGWEFGTNTLFIQNDDHCFEPYMNLPLGEASFDKRRKRLVAAENVCTVFYPGCSVPEGLLEFDGQNVYAFPVLPEGYLGAYVAYDENRQKTLFQGNTETFYEWDGTTVEKVDASFPYDHGLNPSDHGPMTYYPPLKGIVEVIYGRATLLYKDKRWIKLLDSGTPDNLVTTAYYPRDQHLYLFEGDWTGNVYVLKRTHDKPFEKPE